MDKLKELIKYSDPQKAQENAFKYLGKDALLYISTIPKKKFMIYDPNKNKYISFGQMGFEDFTKHGDERRRQAFMKRTAHSRGDWKNNPYSPNNLSREIIWRR